MRTSPGYREYVRPEQYGIRPSEERERLDWMDKEVKSIERALSVLDIGTGGRVYGEQVG
ncbi:hypothetical protein [Mechercharimyces sp. CAU 1602]|uniref:hypothetical protein n=1 Tax=Mechercharimyces sp. CAU 1602 TaxID=2973933 RepID=UPI0021610E4C|nr:hypothetical protein [Mechercharimyces sp. CAU 1602]MCS1351687.1 hypothetical protein [Mechercharimyces sp. CAU 1602]